MSRLALTGVDLYYETYGTGSTVLLVHGSGADARTWGELPHALARGRRLISYDRRGAGRSIARPPPDYRRHLADAVALVEQSNPPVSMVGWSSGGAETLALAEQRPDLVSSVVVVDRLYDGLRSATRGVV